MRTTSERIAEALGRLVTEDTVWVATGSPDGLPHLVPLSLAWDGARALLVTRSDTPTVHNVAWSGRARLALDSAEDVVLFDAEAAVTAMSAADETAVVTYVDQAGWDPRTKAGDWSMLICSPTRMQAWNSVGETHDRTIMSAGQWRTNQEEGAPRER